MDLQGKHAVVTGGGSGIGRAITTALLAAGASVLIVGRDHSRLDAVAATDTGISVLVADLTTEPGRNLLVGQVLADVTPLDLLVNCAGTMSRIDLREASAAGAFDRELALDLTALLPHLLSRPQAAVVNVTTGVVHAPFGDTPAYSTAKAGLRAFTQAVRWQTRPLGCRSWRCSRPPSTPAWSRSTAAPRSHRRSSAGPWSRRCSPARANCGSDRPRPWASRLAWPQPRSTG